jgi:hypothetical protein
MKIIQQITAIMSEVGHIGKDRKNTQQNYNFRGVDDVYAGLQLVMAKHGVIAVPDVLEDRTEDRVTSKGTALIYRVLKIRYRFYADDGSAIDVVVIGEGMAMSVAHKYALLQVFMIPTSEPKDPENDSHDLAGKQTPEMQKKVKAMLEAFGTVAMSATEIEEVVGKPLTQIDEDDLAALRVLLATMRESRAKKAAEAM